ncbi:MAG: 23S rRNA (uracil(1939)-C(5))-methyltransferase RlmD [Neptuniibacter sp.]
MKRKNSLFSQRPKTKTPKPVKKSKTDDSDSVTIERLSHEGRGVAKLGGKTLFIEGALPGERVSFTITQKHRRYDEAVCNEVLEASSARTNPLCQHYGQCGGCDLQHLSHEQQITTKQELVIDQLKRLGSFQPENIITPLISPEWNYRRSCRIGINQLMRDGSAIVGFRRRGSNKLTPIHNCPVLAEPLNNIIQKLPEILEAEDNFKTITHAELSLADNQGAITIRAMKPLTSSLMNAFKSLATDNHFSLFIDNGSTLESCSDNNELIYKIASTQTEISYKPGDFIQVNSTVNEKMISRAIEWLHLSKTDRILDLFCGIGNFTLPVAAYVDSIVGVEGVEEMVERANQNAIRNRLTNSNFYRADLSKDMRSLPWYKQGFNKIILDPPRAGALEIIKQLDTHNPEMILYISCNPAALARDGSELVKQGYRADKFCVMDMFPHTSHVESMMLFVKSDA